MAFELIAGQRTWSGSRDNDGHRDYKVVHRVRGLTTDGPANALQTAGLPAIGSIWVFDDDIDIWAWCRPDATMTPVVENEPGQFFDVEQTFSTKPLTKCTEQQFEDPLLEPQKVSGGFVKYNEEATHDRFGFPLNNSAHEQIRGPQVEFDAARPTIKIEQNVPSLEIELFAPMVETVNETTLWGFPPRCIKLSSASWEKKYRGQCEVYYTRSFEFDIFAKQETDLQGVVSLTLGAGGTDYAVGDIVVLSGGTPSVPSVIRVDAIGGGGTLTDFTILTPGRYKETEVGLSQFSTTGSGTGATFTPVWGYPLYSGFDRDLLDEGTKVLRGDWMRDPASGFYRQYLVDSTLDPELDYRNPANFVRFKDWNGENTRIVLNGKGRPYDPGVGEPPTGTGEDTQTGSLHVEKYRESDFTLLGIPLTF